MKKRILNFVLFFVMIVPCVMLFSACGGMKSLNGKTFVYSKVEVEGSIDKTAYESNYLAISFKFEEEDVTFSDGARQDTYNYKYENKKLYLKASTDTDFPEDPYAEFSGDYMIVCETVEGGIVKVYFKVK